MRILKLGGIKVSEVVHLMHNCSEFKLRGLKKLLHFFVVVSPKCLFFLWLSAALCMGPAWFHTSSWGLYIPAP